MNNSIHFEFSYIDKLYERMGSTWLLDFVYLFIISPIGFVGCCLNLFSFFILYKIKVKETMLYEYLGFYSLNGSLICFLISLSFICYSPRYYPYYLSYFSRINRAFLAPLVSTILYFVCNLLDILIALERLSIFVKSLKAFNRLNPYLVCLSITLLSLIVNMPLFLSYYVKGDDEFYNEIKFNVSTFVYSGRTDYFYSKVGTIITFVQIIIRDILTLLMELVISSFAFYNLREFNHKLIDMDRISNTFSTNRREILCKKILKDRQILLLNSIQTILSLVSHVLVCITYIYGIRGISADLFNWLCIGYFAICFKHFSFFFILCFFNTNFKNKLFNLFSF